MCIDPKEGRLPRYAVCSCGAYFPKCDLEDALSHINPKPGVTNHTWVFIHEEWTKVLGPA